MISIQSTIQSLLDDLVATGRERGVQVAAYHKGKLVVDAFAGIADVSTGRPVDADTLFPVFSVTKGLQATTIHRLVHRGAIEYDTPIAAVWPEFAQHGKGGITLRHALSHMAGIPNVPLGARQKEACDWDAMVRLIAAEKPQWPAGSQMVYHAIIQGWILGEVARRVDGRSFPQRLREEICEPLGIKDLYSGLPAAEEPRVAILEEMFEAGKTPSGIDDGVASPIPAWIQPLHRFMNRSDSRRASIPASNGIATARALAKHYAALLPGGVDGIELLPPGRVGLATQRQWPTAQPEGSPPPAMSLCYFLGGGVSDMGPRETSFGHAGYGGSIGYADPEHGLAVGLTKNLYSKEAGHREVLRAVRDALGVPQ